MDSEIGSVVGQVQAEGWLFFVLIFFYYLLEISADPDLHGNGRVQYEIQKQNGTLDEDEVPFDIDPNNGYIFLLERPLPRLHYTLLVEASDQPTNPSERRYSLAVVQIDVVNKLRGSYFVVMVIFYFFFIFYYFL